MKISNNDISKKKLIRTGIAALAFSAITLGVVIAKRKSKQSLNLISGFVNYFGKSEMLSSSYPRGVRNNNPGNLIMSSENWQGKIPHSQNSDGHFEQFKTYTHGVRALFLDLRSDINKGKNTIAKLINEYAPKHENNTDAYINAIVKSSGIGKNEIITPSKKIIMLLAINIIKVENGKRSNGKAYIRNEHLEQAYAMI